MGNSYINVLLYFLEDKMLIDEIKELVNSMTDDAADRRIDGRGNEARLLDSYSSRFKEILVKYIDDTPRATDACE